ncbi:MAG: hypothetical protein ABL921_12460, partial [Pirellula sp.]
LRIVKPNGKQPSNDSENRATVPSNDSENRATVQSDDSENRATVRAGRLVWIVQIVPIPCCAQIA